MSRWFKWAYSVVFFLLTCGLVAAGTYQYKDNLSIPYNINLFNCVTTPSSAVASCTSMTLQNSGGVEIFTASNPGSVTLTNSSVTLSGSPVSVGVGDGSDSTQGAKGDSPLTSPFNSGSVVAALKGILANVLTPISVTGNINNTPQGSPQNVTVSNQATVNAVISSSPANVTVANTASPAGVAVVNNVAVTTPTPLNVTVGNTINATTTPATSPGNVTVNNSPLAVSIASSPVNITGNLSTSVNSPLGVTPFSGASPQNMTLSASPVSVAISTVSSPVNVTGNFSATVSSPLGVTPFNGASPQNVTFAASPVSVAISTVSSPVNVTGTFTANSSSPTNVNLDQINGQLIASPSTYGVAPVGSTLGVNAFVTNNVNVTTPTPLQVTMPASPLGVAIAGPTPLNVTVGSNVAVTPPTPLQVTLPASPISVGIAGPTPLNVTIATGTNITQIAGNNIASPTGYGTAPVGSVQGMNAFVTNNVNVTTPTPLGITLPASPISVGIVGPTPLNVTIAGPTPIAVTLPSTPVLVAISTVSSPVNITGSITANSASPTNVNLDQINGQLIASPQTYGVAPVGSVLGVNAFITNNANVTPPTPLNVTVGGIVSPQNVTIAGPTPLAVTLPSTPVLVAISTVSSPVNVTGTFTANSSSPTNVNLDQINGQLIASPQTYGVAPVGSVLGVNAFVTNSVNVTTTPGVSPQNVTIASTPLNVTLPASPLGVAIAGPTPLNVTIASTPLNVTLSASPAQVQVTPNPSVFLWNLGTGNSGNIYSQPITLVNTELHGLASSSVTTSVLSFSNASNNTGTSGAVWAEVVFASTATGANAVTCTSGANIAGWFAITFNGTTEGATSGTVALGRPPDFIVPLATTVSLSSYNQKASGLVRMPSMPFKAVVQNNCGATLPTTPNSALYFMPMAVQH